MMRRNIIRIAVLATAAAVVLTVTSRLIDTGNAESARTAVQENGGAGYVVREYNGKIALFTDEFNETPAVETDIVVENLRAYDRQMLAEGITAETYEEVLRLMEDFGS